MEILKLKAATKDYLWGGNRLRESYGKTSENNVIAESWELSAHEDGLSIIENEDYQGKDFKSYLKEKGNKVIGENYQADRFPILIKFIDALSPLSIQVHPRDDYARKYENDNGKTEMWYVLEADENAFLYYGFKENISREEYKKSIEEGYLEDLLNKVFVKKGDVFFIEAGTVHAIGGGIVICEVQQNSNVTYRVYDYMRKDKDGNYRQLHVDKAIEVSNLQINKEYNFNNLNYVNQGLERLAKSDYFDVFKGQVSNEIYKIKKSSFQSLTFIDGKGHILAGDKKYAFTKGDTFYIAAGDGDYSIDGKGQFILAKLPE